MYLCMQKRVLLRHKCSLFQNQPMLGRWRNWRRFHHCFFLHHLPELETQHKYISLLSCLPWSLHLFITYSHHHPCPGCHPHQSPPSLFFSSCQGASSPGCPLPAPLAALLQFSTPGRDRELVKWAGTWWANKVKKATSTLHQHTRAAVQNNEGKKSHQTFKLSSMSLSNTFLDFFFFFFWLKKFKSFKSSDGSENIKQTLLRTGQIYLTNIDTFC